MKLHLEFLDAENRVTSSSVSEDEALKATLAFDWEAELLQAQSLQLCSPTVSLEYPDKKQVLWASAIEKNSEIEFLVCFQEKRQPSGLMSLFSSREKDASVAEKDEIVLSSLPNLFRLFYLGEFESLEKAIKNA
jgi:hypothetical protein